MVALLEAFNPGDHEVVHARFVGGANMLTRVSAFDFLIERLSVSATG
ncbi:hypothetical protein [Sphingomonas oleivorans]